MTFKPKDLVAHKKKPNMAIGKVRSVLTTGTFKGKEITKKNPVVVVNLFKGIEKHVVLNSIAGIYEDYASNFVTPKK